MQDMLSEIQHLFERGEKDDALDLLHLYIDAHPADVDALTLKVDFSLDTKREHEFIGKTLLELPRSERLTDLIRRRDALVKELLKEGRDILKGRTPSTAYDRFDKASLLAPQDAYIPLAAGLALLRHPNVRPENPFGGFGSLGSNLPRLPSPAWSGIVEKYFRAARERATDDATRERAVYHLVKHWFGQNKLTQEALTFLLEVRVPLHRTDKLIADALERVTTATLNAATTFLHVEDNAAAERILKACSRLRMKTPRFALLMGELAVDEPLTAVKHYEDVIKWGKGKHPPIKLADAKTLLMLAQETPLNCPHCGKETPITFNECMICGTGLTVRQLLTDRYVIDLALINVLAQLGMAEMCEKAGDLPSAHKHAQAALDLLPKDHTSAALIRALVLRLSIGEPPTADQPALKAYDLYAHGGLSAEFLMQVSRINERKPTDWHALPVRQRSKLVKALIAGRQLKLAAETIDAAFGDKPKQIAGLRAALDQQIDAQIAELLHGAALLPEALITASSKLLELKTDPELLYARGMARLATDHDLLALDDFYNVISLTLDESLKARARKQAVGVLERRWNIEGARMILNTLDAKDPDVTMVRERLDRREKGEPVVHIQEASEAVMEDTLTRKPTAPYYHGYFAIAVREVGYPGNVDPQWYQRLMTAHYEFVQVIGALRDVMGDAVFVLRLISSPHTLIPERGTMTVALLARVSAGTADVCRSDALQLWTDIHATLPLGQENIYVFEPVVDEDELRHLLTPFEYAHTAEIARRETDANEAKFIAPFIASTFDIHNLHWVFLRQNQPAMISIHLKPTNLLPWEKLTTAQAINRATMDDGGMQPVTPEGFKMMSRVQLWEELRQTHAHNNYLKFAYLLRVYIAGSAGTSQLLPEMAGAALFGSVRDAGQIGGYEIIRAASPAEAAITRRNLSLLDVEASAGQSRMRYLVAETEAANVFRLPVPQSDGIPGMIKLEGKPVVPPAGMPDSGARLGVSAARVKGVPMPIMQGLNDRRRHMYVVGKTGMGKSTLLMTLILQDIEQGRGVFLLDPHGDLCEDVLARIPSYRADDVIVLDPSDEERPLGINILEAETEADKYRITNEFIAMLMRLYDPHNQAIVGPIFQQTVRNAMLAAMSLDDGTLVDVYRIISEPEYIKRVIPFIKDPIVKSYYDDVSRKMSGASDHWKAELLPYLLSKFSRFVEDGTLRRMIGQPKTSVPWYKVIEEQKILLVNLAKGRIGQDNASFIGGLVLSGMLQAAFKRGELPANKRKDFFMYIDEVQNFSTPMLATMLSEGRKFGVVMTIANQFLHQLDHTILEAVFGNVGSLVAFRVGTQDAPALAPEMYPSFGAGDLINLPQFTAGVKLMIDGVAARPFTMKTLPPMRPPDRVSAEAIRKQSALRYGTDMALVQQEIMKKF